MHFTYTMPILTDRGKEFYRWKTIEKHFKIRVYFCDAGKPRQKALVERINRDIRRWLGQNESLINIRSRLKVILVCLYKINKIYFFVMFNFKILKINIKNNIFILLFFVIIDFYF